MTAPNQAAFDAAVAASAARYQPEQSELLASLRGVMPDSEAGDLSLRLEDMRHQARCLASALANGVDASAIIEALRLLGADDK